ncbi:MAG TPA: helix-turn-helix transcriptional regulator [Bdellovibrionota bacterium]|nr:helix-turn-helix transcriptional regulator [Bdellovibrionota bacterium]
MNASDRVRHNIIKIRKEKGYTQERLAYESDMSKGHLSEIESGRKSPTVRTLEKIAETLEVPLSKLTF